MLALSLSAGHDPGLYRVEVIRKLISDGSGQRNASTATLARLPFRRDRNWTSSVPAWQGGLSDHAGSGRPPTPAVLCSDVPSTFWFMRLWSATYPHQSVLDDFCDIHYYARFVQRAHGARCHLLGWACDFALTSSCPQVLPYQARSASQEGEPLIDYFLLPGWMALIDC